MLNVAMDGKPYWSFQLLKALVSDCGMRSVTVRVLATPLGTLGLVNVPLPSPQYGSLAWNEPVD